MYEDQKNLFHPPDAGCVCMALVYMADQPLRSGLQAKRNRRGSYEDELCLVDAKATSNTGVQVFFSEDVDLTSAQEPAHYAISGLSVISAVRSASDHSIVGLTTSAQEDTTYLLTVTNVIDDSSKSFCGDVAPFIESVSSYGNSKVAVFFSEPVEEASAQSASNYSIVGLSVFTATRSTDDYSKVILETSSQSGNTIYTLAIGNVTDENGNPLTDPNTMHNRQHSADSALG